MLCKCLQPGTPSSCWGIWQCPDEDQPWLPAHSTAISDMRWQTQHSCEWGSHAMKEEHAREDITYCSDAASRSALSCSAESAWSCPVPVVWSPRTCEDGHGVALSCRLVQRLFNRWVVLTVLNSRSAGSPGILRTSLSLCVLPYIDAERGP